MLILGSYYNKISSVRLQVYRNVIYDSTYNHTNIMLVLRIFSIMILDINKLLKRNIEIAESIIVYIDIV